MADHYTTTTKTGYGSRLVSSIKGIGFGLLLFVLSFVVLWRNEGAVDVSKIAGNAVSISADEDNSAEDGNLVAVSGVLKTEEKLGDGLYLVDGDYLTVGRKAELYAWVEKTSSKSEKKLGGSEETTTTYDYVKEWTSNPTSTSDFKHPEGHENSSLLVTSDSFKVSSAKYGIYSVDMEKLSLPSGSPLVLKEENVNFSGDAVLQGNYVYIPVKRGVDVKVAFVTTATATTSDSSYDYYFADTTETAITTVTATAGDTVSETTKSVGAPVLGDMRISYTALKNNVEGTLYGKLSGGEIVTFVDKKTGEKLYRLFKGTPEEAQATLHGEYKFKLWLWRAIGFFMMWFGLGALVAPLSVLLDVVPFLGDLSRGITGFVTFLIALVLSVVTILVSMLFHSLIALVLVVLVVVGVVVYMFKNKAKKAVDGKKNEVKEEKK